MPGHERITQYSLGQLAAAGHNKLNNSLCRPTPSHPPGARMGQLAPKVGTESFCVDGLLGLFQYHTLRRPIPHCPPGTRKGPRGSARGGSGRLGIVADRRPGPASLDCSESVRRDGIHSAAPSRSRVSRGSTPHPLSALSFSAPSLPLSLPPSLPASLQYSYSGRFRGSADPQHPAEPSPVPPPPSRGQHQYEVRSAFIMCATPAARALCDRRGDRSIWNLGTL